MRKITIAGFSSVGKKTLIKSLIEDQKYRDKFGVTGSVEAFGYAFQPLEKMSQSKADTILFQWQFGDHNLVSGSDKIYVLWRDYPQHHSDWVKYYHKVYPWIINTDIDYLKEKWHDVINRFEGLNFEVVNVSGWF